MVKIGEYIFKGCLSTFFIRKVPWGKKVLTSDTGLPSASHSGCDGTGTVAVFVSCCCVTNELQTRCLIATVNGLHLTQFLC